MQYLNLEQCGERDARATFVVQASRLHPRRLRIVRRPVRKAGKLRIFEEFLTAVRDAIG